MARTVVLVNPPAFIARSKIFSLQNKSSTLHQCSVPRHFFSNMFFSLAPYPRKAPSFHPSYPTPVHQSNFKRNSATERPLQTLLRYFTTSFTTIRLLLFQSIAMLADDDIRRRCIFQPGRFILQSLSIPRRRGRPKQM